MSITINGTTGVSGVDGSSTTPAFQGTDTNTGLFYGTDIVGISTGGSERVRVDASGNVNIGQTSTPSGWGVQAKVSVKQSSVSGAAGFLSFSSSNENAIFLGYDSTNSIGRVGVSYGSTGSFTPLVFETGGAERMRIDSSGNVLVGTTSANIYNATTGSGINLEAGSNTSIARSGLGVALNINKTDYTSGTTYFMQFTVNNSEKGTISSNGSTTSYTTTSDYRLKENIVPMVGALETVNKLKPVTYTWKESGVSSQGFIAHELQAVVSDAVTGEKDAIDEEGKPIYQGVDTSFLVATLTAAIQEQQTIINDLKARVTALETSNV